MKIKTKKDWIIALIFTVLIIYGITTRYSYQFKSFLLNYGNVKLTNMNQPGGYGNLIITILVMTLIIEVILIYKRKSLKYKLLTPFVGIVCSVLLFIGYLINCNLIVSVIGKEEPIQIHADGWNSDSDIVIDDKEKEQLITYCETLKPVPFKQEREYENLYYKSGGSMTTDSFFIWITYPKKYGHHYDLMVCVYQSKIFIQKGYNQENKAIVTFFQDNGLLALVNDMKLK